MSHSEAAPENLDSAPIVTCEQMREIDRRAVEEFRIPVETLMENAGRAVTEQALKFIAQTNLPEPAEALVFCGGGNNCGDGLVAARYLRKKMRTKIIFLKSIETLTGATEKNFEKIRTIAIPYLELPAISAIEGEIGKSALLIDALLGTGFKGKVTGLFLQTIESMNASGKPIISVDVPSGLDADRGKAEGTCVRAQLTVTMGALKKGFLKKESRKWTGKIVVADIGFPNILFESVTKK